METRANHVVIGAFVLVVVAGLFGFVVWLAKVEIDREFALYRVFFDEAVSGLSVGGDVRYNGIPVGTVTAIEIARGDPGRVQVTVEVSRDTPVRSDTVAKLELQGITGVAFIQLQGGSPSAPPPGPAKDGLPPVIQSERSAIQELFAGAPELINRIITLVSEMTLMVNEDNRRAIASILANVEDLSGRLVKRGPELEQVIVDVRNT
ncbi:MAG: MlaD family protein, partial [Alphaproteobacteria bacterium]|nr:MlaD family protein [Alphaproteobacteria bacterium]